MMPMDQSSMHADHAQTGKNDAGRNQCSSTEYHLKTSSGDSLSLKPFMFFPNKLVNPVLLWHYQS